MKDQKTDVTYEAWLSKYGGYANGMTLRDHFAGLAMQSLILKSTGDDNEIVDSAEDAYSIADAMLEARGQ